MISPFTSVLARWTVLSTPRCLTRRLAWTLAGGWLLLSAGVTTVFADDVRSAVDAPSADAIDFFETSVRPVLVGSCMKCHGPEKQSSGLRMDTREAILRGGSLGPAVVPGKPDESLIIQAVARTHEELKMPPKRALLPPEVAALRQWVERGATWGRTAGLSAATATNSGHWAFQPVRPVKVPAVRNQAWARTPVDAFVLARLEREGVAPSPETDRRALIRRATMDLVGIPPTAEEADAFEVDPAPDAYERLVDRLLASPRYGERWGRHWLDVARYADTKGYVFQEERGYPFAFTYRDFVIRAFNSDLAYDKFVMYQIAADQLPLAGDPGPLAAMGFLTVGRRFLNDPNEIIDDRIDLIGRGLLGLSVGCARCHDHKFDPIPAEDYYSLYGVFASSVEPDELPRLDRAGARAVGKEPAIEREIEEARKLRDDFLAARRAELEADLQARLSRYLKAGYDLQFNPRHTMLEKRAGEDKLVAQRLRALIFTWKRRLDSADAVRDPVLGPWKSFSLLPQESFAAKSKEVIRTQGEPTPGKPGSPHPLLVGAFKDRPPAGMDEVVTRYVEILASLEERSRELDPATRKPRRPLADPTWESLRLAVFGPGGIATVPAEGNRFVLDRVQRQKFNELDNAVKRLQAKSAGKFGRAMVMKDSPQPIEPRVFIRGNPGRPGKPVPRQFLKILSNPDRKPFQQGSGRLELAKAVADPRNPLTARVLVNRVWAWHFGQGLVGTPSDFGTRSDPPSHPELLDDLAAGFIADGWSIKSLHRRIMLSSTYRQRSDLRPDCAQRDPQNRLLWRFPRLRLDFEAARDSILAVSGNLDQDLGGPSVPLNEPPFPPRRTLYGFIDRQNLDGVYRTFDFAVPDASSPKRFVTTVPQQALFLMNSPFIQQQAVSLAASIERDQASNGATSDPAVCARLVYRRVLGRSPEPAELSAAVGFLDNHEREATPAQTGSIPVLAQLAQVLMLTNEFMFVD